MHKVRMNSGGFNPENVKKRIACFEEFDNGHVLRSYEKMSVAESEERARKASIDDPENVYYVSYDDIMEPCSDLYWFQGKSYDNAGVHEALRQYRKSGTGQLNSSRKSLNSSDEQVRVIGTVTIYSDFVDFKRSVSEHLLQTAVGDRAKLKFKWLGDNKVEVRAICAASDERKVKTLLENSDVTKTIAWSSSANSNRKESDKAMRKVQMNSSAGCDEYVKLSTATLQRKLKNATPEEKKCILAELNARGVYPKKSVNSSTTRYLDVDGIMGIPGEEWTYAELADYWDSEQGSDLCLDEYASFEDWVEDTISMMTPLNTSKSVNSAIHPAMLEGIHFEDDGVMYHKDHLSDTDAKVVAYFREEDGKRTPISEGEFNKHFKNYVRRTAAPSTDSEMVRNQAQIEAENAELYSSRKMNSSRKVGNDSMRKVIFRGKLNSSRSRSLNSSEFDPSAFYARYSNYESPTAEEIERYKEWLGPQRTAEYEAERIGTMSTGSVKKYCSKCGELLTSKNCPSGSCHFVSELGDDEGHMWRDFCDACWNTVKNMTADEICAQYHTMPFDVDLDDATPYLDGTKVWKGEDISSSRKLNSSEEDAADVAAAETEASTETEAGTETEVQDTGVDGGEDAAETEDLLEDALIVQNPDTKEVSLFVVTEEDEAVPPEVDVIAEVTPVGEADILDSSRRLKKFATAKLNSSKGCLNSDSDVCPGCGKPYSECECEPGTVAYDEIQLPDDTIVEVENIVIVKDEDDDLGLFMPETADEVVPEGYEVVAVATPAAEAEILDSSRRVKKSGANKLNSKKR